MTDKEAYEIISENTNWRWVFPEDVRYENEWIFHRVREDDTMNYFKPDDAIDCYSIHSLYRMEITGYPIEPWGGCLFIESPFKNNNSKRVAKTIEDLNESYKKRMEQKYLDNKKPLGLDSSYEEQSTGYTWKEAPIHLKDAARWLSHSCKISTIEAYQLILEKLTPENLKEAADRVVKAKEVIS